MKRSVLLFSAVAVLALNACAKDPHGEIQENPHYWQRVSASDQAYIEGPKAQQMLDRQIARCVVELRELERQGIIKDAIPADAKGHVMNSYEHDLARWNTPERDGELLNEYLPYTNFEDCMDANGWERVQTLPFELAAASRENYLKTHGLLTKERKEEKRARERQNFKSLND